MALNEFTRTVVLSTGSAHLAGLEADLKASINQLTSNPEISQSDLLNLQFRMQHFTLFVQALSTIQKEMADMLKGIVSKF